MDQSQQDTDSGCLARAIGPQVAEDLSALDTQVNTVQRDLVTKRAFQTLGFYCSATQDTLTSILQARALSLYQAVYRKFVKSPKTPCPWAFYTKVVTLPSTKVFPVATEMAPTDIVPRLS
jgi:hypothetical protein